MELNISEYMESYLAQLKATVMWFHAAHHSAKGKGFVSDHKNLYGSIYTSLDDHFDLLVEKSIALSGSESIACPLTLSSSISHILNSTCVSPANQDSERIVYDAIIMISRLINSVSEVYEKFKSSGYLTLGLEDALTSMANEYEKYLYLLGQRYKK